MGSRLQGAALFRGSCALRGSAERRRYPISRAGLRGAGRSGRWTVPRGPPTAPRALPGRSRASAHAMYVIVSSRRSGWRARSSTRELGACVAPAGIPSQTARPARQRAGREPRRTGTAPAKDPMAPPPAGIVAPCLRAPRRPPPRMKPAHAKCRRAPFSVCRWVWHASLDLFWQVRPLCLT